jgi:soluble lytic murein transglycosylase-like protein
MNQAYWLERERDAIANGRAATFADVKLIHYELAHRYSIEAANAPIARRKPGPKRGLGEQLTAAFQP